MVWFFCLYVLAFCLFLFCFFGCILDARSYTIPNTVQKTRAIYKSCTLVSKSMPGRRCSCVFVFKFLGLFFYFGCGNQRPCKVTANTAIAERTEPSARWSWRVKVFLRALIVCSLVMIPAEWWSGRRSVDRVEFSFVVETFLCALQTTEYRSSAIFNLLGSIWVRVRRTEVPRYIILYLWWSSRYFRFMQSVLSCWSELISKRHFSFGFDIGFPNFIFFRFSCVFRGSDWKDSQWLRWTFRVRLSFCWSLCWTKCHRQRTIRNFKCAGLAISVSCAELIDEQKQPNIRSHRIRVVEVRASKSWTFFKLMRAPLWVWIVRTVLRQLSMKIPATICPKSVSTRVPNSIWIFSTIQTIRILKVATVIPVRSNRPLLRRHRRRRRCHWMHIRMRHRCRHL